MSFKKFVFISLILSLHNLHAQVSLKDTFDLNKYINKGGDLHMRGLNHEALVIFEKAVGYAFKAKNKKQLALSYTNMAAVLHFLGRNDSSIIVANRALVINKELKNRSGISKNLNTLGSAFLNTAKYNLASVNLYESLKIDEELKDEISIGSDYNLLGTLNYYLGDNIKAIEMYEKAAIIYRKLKKYDALGMMENNLGSTFIANNKMEEGLKHYATALEVFKKTNNFGGINMVNEGIASSYYINENYKAAMEMYEKCLEGDKKLGDRFAEAQTLLNMGTCYGNMKEYAKGLTYIQQSLDIFIELKDLEDITVCYSDLSNCFAKLKNYDKALEFYKKFKHSNDSLEKLKRNEELTKRELAYEFTKKSVADSIKAFEEKKIFTVQLKQEKTQRFALYGGLALVLLFSIVVYNRFKLSQKQKTIIEHQKELVDEKQKEILDSINYASRIQNAILPNFKEIENKLPQSFVLYKPKDIVAGDFYWLEEVSPRSMIGGKQLGSTEGCILIAAADCTGHGVPGALVSVVCSNALNRSVKEFDITDPGKILDKTRELVLETFAKSSEDVKDGMDISLLSIQNSKKEGKAEVKWAGANNPLWYFKNEQHVEITADKQAIGKTENPKPFTTHIIDMEKGDTVYLFTDGYADQFGGPKGKKFKYRTLNDFILSIMHLSMPEQQVQLNKKFEDWKGELEQVDDVCIIGIRF